MNRIREDLYLEEQEEKERQKEMVVDFNYISLPF